MNCVRVFIRTLPFAVLAGCAGAPPPPPSGALTISNLRYGPLCDGPYWQVCGQSTSDIAVDGKGSCLYDHQQRPCTWYGFSFDYTPVGSGASLDCEVVSDRKHDEGNPDGVKARGVTTSSYHIDLSGTTGHHVQAQYQGYVKFDGVQTLTETCSYQGRKMVEVTLRFHYAGAST